MRPGSAIVTALLLMAATPALADSAWTRALADWERVLAQHVDAEGRTDFRALAGDRTALDRVVRAIGTISPATAPQLFPTGQDVLAYHINAYNALAMHGVVDEGIPDGFTSFLKRARFFKFRAVTIGGLKTSLYDYENDIIRPLGEPRVHFALNCMVRDCPRLPREPFLGTTLDVQLEAATREFFSREIHLRRRDDTREVWVSEILKFYTGDFVSSGKPQDLAEYINRYVQQPIPAAYRVRFIPYDWTINQRPLPGGP